MHVLKQIGFRKADSNINDYEPCLSAVISRILHIFIFVVLSWFVANSEGAEVCLKLREFVASFYPVTFL
jgi:hypothetical protein